jgi:hypothetical protein
LTNREQWTRREELIVALLRNHDLGASTKEGVRGDDGSVALLPHSSTCRMRTAAPARCTCWLRGLAELERCMRLMRQQQRHLWLAVHERYVAVIRKPLDVQVSHWQPLVGENIEVIGLLNKTDLNKRGDGNSRVLVEMWRQGVNPNDVVAGIRWLAATFEGSPELPVELLEAA